MDTEQCPFTGGECDGGIVYPDGTVGCGFKPSADDECVWFTDVPDGMSPRDFYNDAVISVLT